MPDMAHPLHCEVYLCTETYEPGEYIKALFNSMTRKKVRGEFWNKHWLLVFDYGEDTVHVFEATKEKDGKLMGQKSYRKRAAFEEIDPTMKRNLGKHDVPQWRLDAVLRKMSDCGAYNLKSNNCQTWAASFLTELGITPPKNEHQAKDAWYRSILPGCATAVGVAVGFVALIITTAMRTRKQHN